MNNDLLKQVKHKIIGEGLLKRSAVAIALTEKDDIILEIRSERLPISLETSAFLAEGWKRMRSQSRQLFGN